MPDISLLYFNFLRARYVTFLCLNLLILNSRYITFILQYLYVTFLYLNLLRLNARYITQLELFEIDDIGDDSDDDYLPNFKPLMLGFQISQRGTRQKVSKFMRKKYFYEYERIHLKRHDFSRMCHQQRNAHCIRAYKPTMN